jgi:hypothetical protein
MAVPNTDTFTLDDVLQELGLGDGDSLQDCFDDATSSSFDTNYNPNSDGTDNNLLNFRNYGSTTVNTLTVTIDSIGFPPISLARVGNESTKTQNITFKWQYVSQAGDIPATVSYGGVARSAGYTTPNITGAFGDGAEYQPFYITGGNATTITFKFTLISATVDNVPSSPSNQININYQQGY